MTTPESPRPCCAAAAALNRKLLASWLGVAALGLNPIDLMSSCRPNRLLLMTIAVDVVALHGLYAYICPEIWPPRTPSAVTEAA